MTTPAGWYPASDGTVRMQWWDGTAWGDQFAEPQGADAEWFKAKEKTLTTEAPAILASEKKLTVFNALKEARALREENHRLNTLIEKHGLLEVAQLDAVKTDYEQQTTAVAAELESVRAQLQEAEAELGSVRSEVLDVRSAGSLQELGLYDFEHPAEASVALGTQLASVRSHIKSMIQQRTATTANTSFTFNNSASKGRKFVKDMSSILLRAYNAETENCIKSVRAGNLPTAQARLSRVKDQIARQGGMVDLRIAEAFHSLRLQELELASRHLQAVQAEKQLAKDRRAELAEQRKAEAELKREQDRLGKERSHYLATLAALEQQGDAEAAERMRARLTEVERAIADVDYRAANIRAGYVYVISNLGSFGENIVKIGMTRRLEPMDRVNELGDASVPFKFDVHALFFADDAVGIEADLHRAFAEQRVNKVNLRREFFRVTPALVLETLRERAVEVVEFTEDAEAPEFRMSGPAATSP